MSPALAAGFLAAAYLAALFGLVALMIALAFAGRDPWNGDGR